MELIDREALRRRVKTECNPYGKPTIDFESGSKVLKIIDNAPAVDAVPVVRCKDCRFNTSERKCLYPDSIIKNPADSDYCSYGERKAELNAEKGKNMTDKEAYVMIQHWWESIGKPTTGCATAINIAVDALRERIDGGWRSVKDKLPEEFEEVLVTSGDMFNVTDYCTDYEGNPSWGYTGFGDREVTYWQPLPAPPSEKGEEP